MLRKMQKSTLKILSFPSTVFLQVTQEFKSEHKQRERARNVELRLHFPPCFFFHSPPLSYTLRTNRVKKNQLDAQLILSIFRQPLHISGVSRPIIRRYNRMYTTIGTYYSFQMTVRCPGWIGIVWAQIRPKYVEVDEIY